MKDKVQLLIGALGLLAVGVIMVADSKARLAHYLEIADDGVNAIGRVVDVRYDYGSDRGWRPSVRFEGQDGTEYEFVSTSYYWQEWLVPDVGDDVPIVYSRSDPRQAIIDTLWGKFGSSIYWLLLGGFILVGLGIWGLEIVFRIK